MALPRYITDIDRITQIPEEEREKLKAITEKIRLSGQRLLPWVN